MTQDAYGPSIEMIRGYVECEVDNAIDLSAIFHGQ